MLSMDEAHRRDHGEQERMRQARQALLVFLAEPSTRLHPKTRAVLTEATSRLWEDMQRITAVWD